MYIYIYIYIERERERYIHTDPEARGGRGVQALVNRRRENMVGVNMVLA